MGAIIPNNRAFTADNRFLVYGSVVFGSEGQKPDPENPGTLKQIFIDQEETTPAQNPQPLDGDAKFQQGGSTGKLFGSGIYSVLVLDSNGVEHAYMPSYSVIDNQTAQEAAEAAEAAQAAAEAAAEGITVPVGASITLAVETIADLRALEPLFDGQQVSLSGYHSTAAPEQPKGGGIFTAKYGNYSAEVSSDTLTGIYVAFPSDQSGTTGAWVRNDINTITPLMFGAIANGQDDDRDKISAMFGMITLGFLNYDFLNLKYYIGTISTHNVGIFEFDKIDHISITGMPKFYVTTAFATQDIRYTDVFRFIDCSDLYVECYADGSDGFDDTAPQASGVVAVRLLSDTTDAENAEVIAEVFGGVAALVGRGSWSVPENPNFRPRQPGDPYWRNIRYKAKATLAKYAVQFISCGNGVSGSVVSDMVTRSYFVTGVDGHYVNIVSNRQRYITDVLIKSYQENTSNIHVDLVQIDPDSTEESWAIEHENDDQLTTISNITINHTGNKTTGSGIGLLGALDINTATYRSETSCKTENVEINYNGNGVGGLSEILNIRSKTLSPSTIRFNRAGGLTVGNDTKNYTMQGGHSFLSASYGASPECFVKFDNLISGEISMDVSIFATEDASDYTTTPAISAKYNLTGYILSSGTGAISNTDVISSNTRGVTPPSITFSIEDGCLKCVSDSATPTAQLTVRAEIVGSGVF